MEKETERPNFWQVKERAIKIIQELGELRQEIIDFQRLESEIDQLKSQKEIEEFEKKLALFPNLKNRTIHKVLITTEGADDPLTNYGYFDRIITLRDIFDAG